MTRNEKVLAEFVKYCEEHPQERFWQALRNWSGYGFVLVGHKPPELPWRKDWPDTFYWEGRDK